MPAKFPIGHHRKSMLLLFLNNVPDRFILRVGEFLSRGLPAVVASKDFF
jgi:hypothetical protein